jgi:hypothetical protein
MVKVLFFSFVFLSFKHFCILRPPTSTYFLLAVPPFFSFLSFLCYYIIESLWGGLMGVRNKEKKLYEYFYKLKIVEHNKFFCSLTSNFDFILRRGN